RLVERELVERRAFDHVDEPEQLPHRQAEVERELPQVRHAPGSLVELAFANRRRQQLKNQVGKVGGTDLVRRLGAGEREDRGSILEDRVEMLFEDAGGL